MKFKHEKRICTKYYYHGTFCLNVEPKVVTCNINLDLDEIG